ncbi:MAG TPA: hypothetical protein ENI51_09820 [Candidatus Atribacteria bacterium]|nr:hypothetical protein [Candidatus Atribacteria bacterium]
MNKILDGYWKVYIGETHILTKKIEGESGKNFLPWGSELFLADFKIKDMELHYKYWPVRDVLEKINEHALKGTMYVRNEKWFDFTMHYAGEINDKQRSKESAL